MSAPPRQGFGTLLGLDHIGVGVSDMATSLDFYAELGFVDVVFDYEGPLPGLSRVAGHTETEARVVYLRSGNPTVLGRSGIKLVQLTNREQPPVPDGFAYGEPGICEVCVHVKDYEPFHESLVASGHRSLMEPNEQVLDPYRTHCGLSYVEDPDGAKIEFIEWSSLEAGWPHPSGPQGVNHVAFGVRDSERTEAFYRRLGFSTKLFDMSGVNEPMDPWFHAVGRQPPEQRMMLLMSPHGGSLEPVQQTPAGPDLRGEWGHLGTFEFALGARNLDLAIDYLASIDVPLVDEPAEVQLPDGASWRFVHIEDPDGLYVSVTEVRA
ncbi:VOC family protein [Plantibacter sp. ME-Dv--P-122b]|uniref:VOC family protein n=1 Tax=Plantibacter sp. ME-Dv--P-122b TaxID=3040300 RepID=UPI00254CC047|nr:VOC family protein [Plantibacter sp. ME-Dv--P-122b]